MAGAVALIILVSAKPETFMEKRLGTQRYDYKNIPSDLIKTTKKTDR